MIRPRFIFWLLFVLLFWVGSHFGHWNWTQLVLIFLLLLPLFSLLAAFVQRQTLRFSISGDERCIERGERAHWYFRLEKGRGPESVFLRALYSDRANHRALQVEEFRLHSGRSFLLDLELPGLHVGELRPRHFALQMTDPLGFFNLPIKKAKAEEFPNVAVLPLSLLSFREKEKSDSPMESSDHVADKSDTELDEIDRMRPMHPGDKIRSIHWKLSARMQQWMVRQYEKADEAQVTLLIAPPSVDKPEDPASESLLFLRDTLLDQVSAAAQSFLSQDFSLRLKLRQPWTEISEYKLPEEYTGLRVQLARLPYPAEIGLMEQLTDEILLSEPRFYCIFTTELSEALANRLLLLAARAQGVMLSQLAPPGGLSREMQEQIQRLSLAGVKVYLHRSRGVSR